MSAFNGAYDDPEPTCEACGQSLDEVPFCDGCACCQECCNCTPTDCDCDSCKERRESE